MAYNRASHWQIVSSLLLCIIKYCFCHEDLHLVLEHSLDGGHNFNRAGFLSGEYPEARGLRSEFRGSVQVESDVELRRDKEPSLSPKTSQALTKLIEDDGFYILRVKTTLGAYITTSVRAACLAQSKNDLEEILSLQLDDARSVVSMAYSLGGLPVGNCKATTGPKLPDGSSVKVMLPEDGPSILGKPHQDRLTKRSGDGAREEVYSEGAFSQFSGEISGGPTARPKGRVPGQAPGSEAAAGDADNAPPPEEKTWWQKNWLMVVGVGMAIMNVIGNVMKNQQGPPGATSGTSPPGGSGTRVPR